jgi:hypothetical protein
MRSLLFVLMITLLLLRGWTGDAMATEMALTPLQHQPSATETMATHAHEMGAEGHLGHEAAAPEALSDVQAAHDCAGHASDEASHAESAHCESCAACQACHTVALTPAEGDSNPVSSSLTRPCTTAVQFASAEAAPGQKPPIS